MNDTYRQDLVSRMQTVEREHYEERLQESEHLATIGRLAATLAHEIKNPLAGISGAIGIIGDALEENHPHREIIREIMRQVDRLDHTVHDLLVYARPRAPDRRDENVVQLLDRVLVLCREEPSCRDLRLVREGNGDPIEAPVDDAQIQQVLMNLLLNAAQASRPGGEIRCRVERAAGVVRLEVEDNGVGIPPDVLPRIFEAFYTTKARGTGLGLAICRRIVEQHGGTLRVFSIVNKGTRVTLELPTRT